MASTKVRGITIELGADTSGISKALSGLNKEIGQTTKDLKDVERLLKLDPTNTELLAQKQKLLNDRVSETKDKLDALKQAQASIDLSTEEGQRQYDALSREIVACEHELKNAEQAASGFNATAEKISVSAGKMSQKFGSLAEKTKGLSMAAAGALAGLAGLAVKAGQNADELNTLSKQTGVATDELQKMQYAADLIDVDTETITSGLRKLKKNLDGHEDTWKKLKVDVKDANGEYRNITDIFYDVAGALGNIENETERDVLAMDLFGKSADELAGIIDDGGAALKELGKQAEDMGVIISQEDLDKANELNDALDTLKAEILPTIAQLGVEIAQAIMPYIPAIKEAIENVLASLRNISPQMVLIVGAILALTAALSPMFSMLSGITGLISALTSSTGALGGALTGLAAPILAAVAAIGVLVAAFIHLWNTNEEFRTKVTEIWTELQTIFGEFVEGLKAKFSEWGLSMDVIKGAWEEFCNFLAPILTAVLELIKNAIGFALDFILGLLSIFHGLFTGNWGEVWDGVKQIFDAAVTFLKDTFGGLVTKLIEKAKELGEKIKEKFEEIKEGVKQKIFDMVSSAVAEFAYFYWTTKEKFEEIKETIKEKIEAAKEKAIEIFTNIVESIKEKVGDIRDRIEEGFNDAVDFITSLPGQAYNWGADIINSIADGIWGAIGSITDAVSGIADTIWSYLHFSEPDVGPLSDFHTWVPDMMHGLADSMKKNMPALKAGVDLVANEMTGVIPGTGTAGRYDGGSGGTHNSWGGVNITVNAAAGQNEEDIADEVMRRMMDLVALEG